MARMVAETSVEEIAHYLENKKSQKQHVGLFLGHRAGGLFNDALYKVVKRRTMIADDLPNLLKRGILIANLAEALRYMQSLDNLSAIDKFSECYGFLSKYFSEKGVHIILNNTLESIRYREEDELLVRLFKSDFFDTIITTNIDSSLEKSCALLEMKEPADYQMIICGVDDSTKLEQGRSWRPQPKVRQIIKVFGDFDSLKYSTLGNEFDLEIDELLKKFLVSQLAKDNIVLGYDPLWDWPIERAIQIADGMLWYVNEEPPLKNSHLAYVLDQRGVKYLVGPQGSYRSFLQTLYEHIGEEASSYYLVVAPSPAPGTPLKPAEVALSADPTRKKAFISYSHNDQKHLERLQIHLKNYLHVEDLAILCDDVWDDTKLHVGAKWQEEIERALSQAKAAVCLVSADFFGSDFIREKELPLLVDAAEAGKLEICPVILSDSAFEQTKLSAYLAINLVTEPLMGMEPYKQETVWAKLAKHIFTILKS